MVAALTPDERTHRRVTCFALFLAGRDQGSRAASHGQVLVAPSWQRAHGRVTMPNSAKDSGIADQTGDGPTAYGDRGASATQDLVEGLSLVVSAAGKALSSLERRDDPKQEHSTLAGFSAEDLTCLLDKGGSRILELLSEVVSELNGRASAKPPNQPDASSATSVGSRRQPHARPGSDD
jgi:hypothetical protein